MKQHLNEVKRLQQLAGLIKESQLNENKDLNSYGKILFDRLQKNGFQPKFVKTNQDFDKSSQQTREKGSKLVVVQYDDMGTPGDGFIMVGGNNDNHDEIGKILDSIKSELPDNARHFSNNTWSWQITGPSMTKKPQEESYNEIRQLVRKTINEINQLDEYEINDVVPGIRMNDEGEYDIDYGLGLELYNDYVKDKSTIGILAGKLKRMGIPEDQLLKVAYAIQDKYSEIYRRNKSRRY